MDDPTTPIAALTHRLAERELTLPFLCFFAAHRPLAFVAGQALYMLEPLALLFGSRLCGDWGALLCDDAALNYLEQTLANPDQSPQDHTTKQP